MALNWELEDLRAQLSAAKQVNVVPAQNTAKK